jgi:hypothetical protein
MNRKAGFIRKLVSILCQRQMIVARNKASENGFHRIVDQWERTAAHLLGTVAALLAPLLEPQIDAGPANPEALGHNARSLSLITGFKRTAA